jgi:hypothetical protein
MNEREFTTPIVKETTKLEASGHDPFIDDLTPKVESHILTSRELATYHMGKILAQQMLEKVAAGGPNHAPEDHRRN